MNIVADYNESELLSLVAQGDENAFRSLFHQYKQKIFSVALRITRSQTIAEELLQDVFLIIWLRREHLSQIEDFESYLFIVARNETYRTLKKIAKLRIDPSDFNPDLFSHRDTEEAISVNEYHSMVQKAIENLPSQQRQAYRLIKEQGLTRDQAAQIMQIGSETVKTHLMMAIKAIRAFLLAHFEIILMAIALGAGNFFSG